MSAWEIEPGAVRLEYFLPEPGHFRIELVDALGIRVTTVFDGETASGEHLNTITDLRTGMYFCTIRGGTTSMVVPVSVVR